MYAALMDRLVYVDLKVAVIWILSDWMLIILHCGKKKKKKRAVLRGMCALPSPEHQPRPPAETPCQLWQTDTPWQIFMGFYPKLCI